MPSAIENLRKQLRDKRASLDTLTSPTNEQGEVRELTPDEVTQFDSLVTECTALKGRVAALEALGDPTPTPEGPDRRSLPPQAPAIHTDATKRPYSILRAIRSRVNGTPFDGIEAEVHNEIARRTGKTPEGILIPTGSDPVIREMLRYGQSERRDLTTTTGAGGIFNVPELPLIELLRAKLVIRKLGAQFATDLRGTFSMPAQTGTSQTYWLNEGVPASLSNPTFAQIPFTPKVAIAATQISRQFINQTSLDAEQIVKNDLAAQMAVELDRVAINGSGGTQPLGLLQNPNVPVVPIGANGGYANWGTVVGLESQIANLNADSGKLAYLTSPKVRGNLKTVSKGNGYPTFVFEDGSEAGEGEMNGYPSYVSSLVPQNLTKGSGTNLSALIFGRWDSMMVGIWEGIDMIINPYSAQLSGAVIISNNMNVDVEVLRTASFAVANDVQYQG